MSWNFLLDGALDPLMKHWQMDGCGIYCLAFIAEPERDLQEVWRQSGWVKLLAYADDQLLAKSAQEPIHMHRTLCAVCAPGSSNLCAFGCGARVCTA